MSGFFLVDSVSGERRQIEIDPIEHLAYVSKSGRRINITEPGAQDRSGCDLVLNSPDGDILTHATAQNHVRVYALRHGWERGVL